MSRVFVVDDHATIREAVRLICEQEADLQFVGGAPSAMAALESLDRERPDVLLVDIDLPSSLDFLREAHERRPEARILGLYDESPPRVLQGALAAGAVGVVSKTAETGEFLGAIRRAAAGRPRTSAGPVSGSEGAEGPPAFASLSPRERDVLALLAHGRTNAQIATTLGISARTVGTHVGSIYLKLQAGSRVEAVRLAHRLGLLPQRPGPADG